METKTICLNNLKRMLKFSIYVQQMLYCSGSGNAPGEVCLITIQNSTKAKNTVAKSKLPIPGQRDETKDERQTLMTAILQKACLPNYRNITKEKKNNMKTEDGSRFIMEANKGNCFVVID